MEHLNLVEYNKTHESWNKGLTKENSASIKQGAEKNSIIQRTINMLFSVYIITIIQQQL